MCACKPGDTAETKIVRLWFFSWRSAFKSKPIIYGNTYQLFCHDSPSGFLLKWLICHNKGHFLINLCWSFLKKERLVTLTRTMQPVMYCTLLFHCMNHVPVSALISGVWCQEVRCQCSQELSSWNELFFPAKCRITWNLLQTEDCWSTCSSFHAKMPLCSLDS